jgi:hypothetical protein
MDRIRDKEFLAKFGTRSLIIHGMCLEILKKVMNKLQSQYPVFGPKLNSTTSRLRKRYARENKSYGLRLPECYQHNNPQIIKTPN